jgi:hypothetical protein
MHFYDSVDIGQSESSLLLNHTIARKEYIYYILYTMLVRPNRGLSDLDAVFNSGIDTRGEGRPDKARGFVLFREPKGVRFQFGCKTIE